LAFGPSIALINADFDATREVFEEIREDLGAYRDGRGLSESDTRSVLEPIRQKVEQAVKL
jgi:hypothetical protein